MAVNMLCSGRVNRHEPAPCQGDRMYGKEILLAGVAIAVAIFFGTINAYGVFIAHRAAGSPINQERNGPSECNHTPTGSYLKCDEQIEP